MPVSLPAAAALAALLATTTPPPQDAVARAMARCEADYVKRTTACRRAIGNYLCLQATLDRFTDCRTRASALAKPPAVRAEEPRAGTRAPAR